jgi:hypothetical protein
MREKKKRNLQIISSGQPINETMVVCNSDRKAMLEDKAILVGELIHSLSGLEEFKAFVFIAEPQNISLSLSFNKLKCRMLQQSTIKKFNEKKKKKRQKGEN